jgi:hypothetical protein
MTKLTLYMDEKVLKKAKVISKNRGTSVSKLVSEYFENLDTGGSALTPVVQSLRGIIKGPKTDYKTIRQDYYESRQARKR